MENTLNKQLETINNMNSLLADFRKKKQEILADASIIDEYKAANYKKIIEWINNFSKTLNVEVSVIIRKEAPLTKVIFYKNENEESTFKIECGPMDKRNEYNYHDLVHEVCEVYKRNDRKLINGPFDHLINIMPFIADNHTVIRQTILNKVEEALYLELDKEEKEFANIVKSATTAVNFSI